MTSRGSQSAMYVSHIMCDSSCALIFWVQKGLLIKVQFLYFYQLFSILVGMFLYVIILFGANLCVYVLKLVGDRLVEFIVQLFFTLHQVNSVLTWIIHKLRSWLNVSDDIHLFPQSDQFMNFGRFIIFGVRFLIDFTYHLSYIVCSLITLTSVPTALRLLVLYTVARFFICLSLYVWYLSVSTLHLQVSFAN